MAKSRFALVLILLLLGLNFVVTAATATPVEVKWSQVSIPAGDETGGWLLAGGSDVKHLSMAATGALYAYADGLDLLLESTNGGGSWTKTGYNGGDVVDIAISILDAGVLYVADGSMVYRSADGAASFVPLPVNLALAASANIAITSIDIGRLGDRSLVVVGTRDNDAGEFGGVYVLDEGQPFSNWLDTRIGNYDVVSIATAPDFATSGKIIALVTNDAPETLVISNDGIIGNWDTVAELLEGNTASFKVTAASEIGFPSDYADTETLFVGVVGDTTGGDVYIVYGAEAGSAAVDLNIGSGYGSSSIDVISLAVSGDTRDVSLLAGAAGSGQVYRSSDGGASWEISLKEPSGQSVTGVLMAADFGSSRKAYVATSGVESAVSRTSDGGATWNQVGLIDTAIGNMVDLAVSPNHSQDGVLFLLTWGGEFSLWRSLGDVDGWERVFSSAPGSVSSIDMVGLSPQYGDSSQVLFIAGSGDGNPAIWKSADNGQSFSRRGVPLPVDQWAVAGDATFFVAGYDGSSGLIYRTNNSGLSYSTGAAIGSQSLSSIALSPDYDQDGTILVGNSNGWVYWSNDNGASFEPLPSGATLPPISGNLSVAFAPRFGSSRTVYAASDTPSAGIYRFVIGDSAGWQSIDSTLPAGGMVHRLTVSADGTLYAANFQQVDTVSGKGGVERCLEPASSLGTTFETVTSGLSDGTTLWGLWLNGNQLWSIDTTNNRLMTYIDSLSQPVLLSSPADGALGIDTTGGVRLFWQPLTGATGYWWQLADEDNFSSVPTGFEGNTGSSSVGLPVLMTATTYYWRVRATLPVLSPWSEKWSFTTPPGPPGAVLTAGLMPAHGAISVPVSGPAFVWAAPAGGAISYDFELSTDLTFAAITEGVMNVTVPYFVWDGPLENETAYYWRVRSVTAAGVSSWITQVFTTVVAIPPVVIPPQLTPTITIKIPEILWPEIPDLSDLIPDVILPPVEMPDVILPEIVIPDIAIPEVEMPNIILPEIVLPDIILPAPTVNVGLPTPTITTVESVINVKKVTPAYIWATVIIGGILVIAVIVLIVRPKRIV